MNIDWTSVDLWLIPLANVVGLIVLRLPNVGWLHNKFIPRLLFVLLFAANLIQRLVTFTNTAFPSVGMEGAGEVALAGFSWGLFLAIVKAVVDAVIQNAGQWLTYEAGIRRVLKPESAMRTKTD